MRKFFIYSTVIFWIAITGFWLAASLRDSSTDNASLQPTPEPQGFSLTEVMRHNHANDCWMVIAGNVYDVTAYLPSHPSQPDIITAWCGKEASMAWQTKTRGRPHSSYAETLLQQYKIGVLRTPS